MSTLLNLVVAILNLVCLNESARILGVFPNYGYSQYILGNTLMKQLATRGHEVTVISPYSEKNPVKNYKEIVTKIAENPDDTTSMFDLESLDIFRNMVFLYDAGLFMTEQTLKDPQVQKLLQSDASFDLVITEAFVNEATMGFAHHFHAPLILFCTMSAVEWTNHLVANPAPFSHIPITFAGYTDEMTFWQRLRNSAAGFFDIFYKHLVYFPQHNAILQKYFPNPPHHLKDLLYNSSLILLNSHVATNAPMAHVPNMVEIGGFHVSPKKLPRDLQEFLDGAVDGAVLFSMGTNLKISDLSKEKFDAILGVFGRLKQKILWKWEEGELPGKPKNVKIEKWLPLQDVLAHPNIRAFITHGGLLSMTEALYSGVPLIGIPVFGDQKMNVETAIRHGFAVKIPFQKFTEETLGKAVDQVLTNTSYREAALRRSKILKDLPMKPMDTAVFWIEYVLRHGKANHLRSSALKLQWYQYFLVDVVAFVLVVVIGIIMLCRLLFCKIFERLGRRKVNVNKKKL